MWVEGHKSKHPGGLRKARAQYETQAMKEDSRNARNVAQRLNCEGVSSPRNDGEEPAQTGQDVE